MAHWSERWLARPCPDDWDCADFAREVAREQFGLDVRLPSERAAGLRGRDAQISIGAGALADAVDAPRDGDVVLMRAVGRRRSVGHHIGIWCGLGEPHVLHLMAGTRHACLHPLALIGRVGLEETGVYRWR